MIKSTKYTVLSGLFIVLTVLLSSCEKANDWETDSAYNRLFRSTKLAVSPSINDAEVIWNNTINTDYYIIEVNTSELTAENYQEGSVIFGEDDNAVAQNTIQTDIIEKSGKILNPRTINKDGSISYIPIDDWCSGFFHGSMWLTYNLTGDQKWLPLAECICQYFN